MTLFPSHTAETKNHKHDTSAGTHKPGFQAKSDQQPKAKSQHHISKQLIPPAHKNTPCTAYAGGVLFFT